MTKDKLKKDDVVMSMKSRINKRHMICSANFKNKELIIAWKFISVSLNEFLLETFNSLIFLLINVKIIF